MDEMSLNTLLERCRNTVDEIAVIYHYPSNITHLLYLIVPAFIIKYGYDQERYLFKAFTEIPVLILDSGDKVYQAYYSSIPEKSENGYVTRKGIVLKHYQDINLMQLLDNLTHEFNHAVNSIHNEILEKDDHLYIRTGLTYIIYDKNTLKPISKEVLLINIQFMIERFLILYIRLVIPLPINVIDRELIYYSHYCVKN